MKYRRASCSIMLSIAKVDLYSRYQHLVSIMVRFVNAMVVQYVSPTEIRIINHLLSNSSLDVQRRPTQRRVDAISFIVLSRHQTTTFLHRNE